MSDPGPVQRRMEQRRLERVAEMQQQIKAGTLRIRKMTKAEKEFWGPVKDPKAAARRAKRKADRA